MKGMKILDPHISKIGIGFNFPYLPKISRKEATFYKKEFILPSFSRRKNSVENITCVLTIFARAMSSKVEPPELRSFKCIVC